MENELTHWGVLGMKWGVRKAEENSGPTSSDHDKAMAKRNPFKASVSEYSSSRNRINLEKRFLTLQKRANTENPKDPRSLSNKEIRDILKSPIMKKTTRELQRERVAQGEKAAKILIAGIFGAYALHAIGADRFVLGKVKQGLTTVVNNRKYVKVAANVIDSHFVY